MNRISTALILLFFLVEAHSSWAQKSHFGAFYQYGATLNLDGSNDRKLRLNDGSGAGIYYQLDNGVKALGFRASLNARWNDIRWDVTENVFILNKTRAVELKLQCTLRTSDKNMFALGMAPRIVTSEVFSLGSKSSAAATTIESDRVIMGLNSEPNALNSALCLSWYHELHPKISVGLHLDSDMIPFYRSAVDVPVDDHGGIRSVNVRLTSLTAALIINVR